MKFEEVSKLVVSRLNGNQRMSSYSKFYPEESEEIISLFIDIKNLCNSESFCRPIFLNKARAIKHIKSNPLVLDFSKVKNKPNTYYINTKRGSGYFYDSRLISRGKTPKHIVPFKCHENSIKQVYAIHKSNPLRTPELLSGIAEIPLAPTNGNWIKFKPVLHSVYSIDTINGRMIVDFNYNIQMSEELYKMLFSFEVLSQADAETVDKLWNTYWKFYDQLPNSREKEYPITYLALAPKEMTEYLSDVMAGVRKDDYEFVNEVNFKEYKKTHDIK